LVLLLLGCGAKTGNYQTDYAGPITLRLVNQTPRQIEQVFLFPRGATNRGPSWTSLAPGASTPVKIQTGAFELVAISAKRRIDAKFSERPEATTLLELREDRGDVTLIFHDDGQPPAGINGNTMIGVAFMISAATPEPETSPQPPQTP
jgi:hypothetical protein